jgi:mannose-6-phosphate isomerase-like protein (cupin superfamily)
MIGETKSLPSARDVLAPDGSEVRILLARSGGSMAHFRLPQGQVSQAVRHRSVEEIWYVLSGSGEMWQSDGAASATFPLRPGVCLTIPACVAFQFRTLGPEALTAVAITMPPWPGDAEAEPVAGPWEPRHGSLNKAGP